MIKMKRIMAAIAIAVMSCTLSAGISPAAAQNPREFYRDPFYPPALDYCWFDDGWQGPGWYLCDAPWYRGDGWGDRFGWGNRWRNWHTRPHHHPHGPRPAPGRPPVGGQPGLPKPPGQPGGGQPGGSSGIGRPGPEGGSH
jgi:hypothetical protein